MDLAPCGGNCRYHNIQKYGEKLCISRINFSHTFELLRNSDHSKPIERIRLFFFATTEAMSCNTACMVRHLRKNTHGVKQVVSGTEPKGLGLGCRRRWDGCIDRISAEMD